MHETPVDASDLTIRFAEPRDAGTIAATLRAAFAEFEALYTPAAFRATTPTTDEIVERLAEGPLWIAKFGGTVVGTVSAVAEGSDLYIRSMAVIPAARGLRIGAKLLHAIEAFAVAKGFHRLVLDTTPFLLAACRLYQRHGFQYTGEEPDLFGTRLLTMAKSIN